MEIIKNFNENELTLGLVGRLDTNTAPLLDAELQGSMEGITALVLDMADLEYISSAGLRVLLATKKMMDAKEGTLVLRNVIPDVQDVFDITGFCDILTIE